MDGGRLRERKGSPLNEALSAEELNASFRSDSTDTTSLNSDYALKLTPDVVTRVHARVWNAVAPVFTPGMLPVMQTHWHLIRRRTRMGPSRALMPITTLQTPLCLCARPPATNLIRCHTQANRVRLCRLRPRVPLAAAAVRTSLRLLDLGARGVQFFTCRPTPAKKVWIWITSRNLSVTSPEHQIERLLKEKDELAKLLREKEAKWEAKWEEREAKWEAKERAIRQEAKERERAIRQEAKERERAIRQEAKEREAKWEAKEVKWETKEHAIRQEAKERETKWEAKERAIRQEVKEREAKWEAKERAIRQEVKEREAEREAKWDAREAKWEAKERAIREEAKEREQTIWQEVKEREAKWEVERKELIDRLLEKFT
ncbi:hypothetical protein BXZ70DRAFT_1009052 [Cristinia sonorae]|uniref:Uncharacterized protein n=1 Tax=Cristinia sonorae TaxID=1940300 RepID=A0A8K0UMV8_9AGAR|nr:hypothetical protein BXZ70DRAFT_1009052 [Cristinia sonorae]